MKKKNKLYYLRFINDTDSYICKKNSEGYFVIKRLTNGSSHFDRGHTIRTRFLKAIGPLTYEVKSLCKITELLYNRRR